MLDDVGPTSSDVTIIMRVIITNLSQYHLNCEQGVLQWAADVIEDLNVIEQ